LAETSVAKSRPSVPYGANFFCVKCLNLESMYVESHGL